MSLTVEAEGVIRKHLQEMFKELLTLGENVEDTGPYNEDHEDGRYIGLNSDTALREKLHEFVEDNLSETLYVVLAEHNKTKELANTKLPEPVLNTLEIPLLDDVKAVIRYKDKPQSLPSFRELHSAYFKAVMRLVNGNRSETARIVGVDRRTAYRLMERYGVNIPSPAAQKSADFLDAPDPL